MVQTNNKNIPVSSINDQLEKLDLELDEYSFNNSEIDDSVKQEIKNLYSVLWKINQKKIIIGNLDNKNIYLTNNKKSLQEKKVVVQSEKNIIYSNIKNKNSIYLEKCNKCKIFIDSTISHLRLVNCHNNRLIINKNVITGVDIINSTEISLNVLKDINFIDFSNAKNCIYNQKEENLPLVLSLYGSLNFKLFINDKLYKHHNNLFEIYNLYLLDKINNDIRCDKL